MGQTRSNANSPGHTQCKADNPTCYTDNPQRCTKHPQAKISRRDRALSLGDHMFLSEDAKVGGEGAVRGSFYPWRGLATLARARASS